jgi:HEAT repeat protein
VLSQLGKEEAMFWRMAVFLVLIAGAQARGSDLATAVNLQLAEMARRGSAYDAKEMNALGTAGLEALLDRLFPETAAAPRVELSDDELAALIVQLAAEDFRTRQDATQTLIAKARTHREAIEKAADHRDAEVRLRARLILATWDAKPTTTWDKHVDGCSAFLGQIRDRERLDLLAQRTVAVLQAGMPTRDRLKLMRVCLAGLALGGDEASCDRLRPLMEHPDPRVAELVVESIGAYREDPAFFPRVLIDGLENDRPAVVEAALRWSTNGGSEERAKDVERAVRRVFTGSNSSLKFQASFLLMHTFDDAEAFAYLLEQTKSDDIKQAFTAIHWVGDACHSGKPVTREILNAFDPHLESKNAELRRAATDALGTYQGEEVVKRLIPMLGDLVSIIATGAEVGLLNQNDKTILRRHLTEASEKNPDRRVSDAAIELLEKLNDKEHRRSSPAK